MFVQSNIWIFVFMNLYTVSKMGLVVISFIKVCASHDCTQSISL